MSAESRTGQPAEGTASGGPSRRTFLKGVGLAGAAGLAAPLLATTTARAATEGIVLGANAGCWSPPTGTESWPQAVKGALGCRSYRDIPFKQASDFAGTTFPGEPGSKPVASIRPDPTNLLNGDFDSVIKDFIATGMASAGNSSNPNNLAGTPQLTVWHEAGNLYMDKTAPIPNTNWTWGDFDLSPQTVRSMHVYMQDLCNQVATANPTLPRVEYGSIIYGEISKMASDTDSTHNWVPDPGYPLDWYGIDVYYEGDPPNTGSTSPHPDLATYDLVSQYMGGFLSMAQNRSGLTWPKINVCECNANVTDDGSRPLFFENLALWLSNNGGRRMLTFFPAQAGPHSVTWEHVVDAAPPQLTLDALNYIQRTYG